MALRMLRGLLCLLLLSVVAGHALAESSSSSSSGTVKQPTFHIRPHSNWINDPNGPYRDPKTGIIHLYMQYNPYGPLWGNMSWYHVTSTDYVHWKRPSADAGLNGVAMVPDHWYDNYGVYSGSMINNALGVPVVFYTCVENINVQRQCVASPSADGFNSSEPMDFDSFTKDPVNPIADMGDVPGLQDVVNFRDPTEVWRDPADESRWLIAFAARMNNSEGDEGHVVVFQTEDPMFMRGFSYSHSLYSYAYDPDKMFECPDFFTLGNNLNASATVPHFLKLSTMPAHRDYIVYGDYHATHGDNSSYVFDADAQRTFTLVDNGPVYASKTFYDPILRRRMIWGWLNEDLVDDLITEQGWSGVQTLPRVVTYSEEEERLAFAPAPELRALRRQKLLQQSGVAVTGTSAVPTVIVAPSANVTLYHEIVATFHVNEAMFDPTMYYDADVVPEFGVMIRGSGNFSQYTTVSVGMPTGAARQPMQDRAQDSAWPAMKTFAAADTNPVRNCSEECTRERMCMSWTYTADAASPLCTLYWRTSGYVANAVATSNIVNTPQLRLGRAVSGSIGATSDILGRAPLLKSKKGKVELHIYVDDSVIEVYKDGGVDVLSGRVYMPNGEALTGIALYANNMGSTVTADVEVFTMGSIWDE